MAREIDKIVSQKVAPKDKNVLWDNGKELLINRNGKWENANTTEIKENSIPLNALSKEIQQKIGHYWYISHIQGMHFDRVKDFIEEFGIWFPYISFDGYDYKSECEIMNKADFCNRVFYTYDDSTGKNSSKLYKIVGFNSSDIFIYNYEENKINKYKLYMIFADETENTPIGPIFERVN